MTGKGNIAETIKVTFDPERVSVDELLTYFFRVIDPTVKDQQGNDIGVQYRTWFFYDKNCHKHIIEDEVKQEQTNNDKEIISDVLQLNNYNLEEEIHID